MLIIFIYLFLFTNLLLLAIYPSPLHWKQGVLTTALPEKSLKMLIISNSSWEKAMRRDEHIHKDYCA